jgi:hypothetical protein
MMALEAEIRIELKKLLAAIAHKNNAEAMKAHKALYKIGSSTIPFVADALLNLDLSQTSSAQVISGVEIRYAIGLISLIHDIDENASNKVAQQFIQKGCKATTKQRLKSILEFTLDDYLQYEVQGIKIFEEKEIKSQVNIQSKLEKWLSNVSEADLSEIDRLYVVSQTKDQEYAGRYTPIFYNVKLVWDVSGTKFNPITWLKLLWLEMVLYHEIGHHVYRHTFGQQEEQEAEADKYAVGRFLSTRPALYKTSEAIFKVVKLFRRKSKWQAAA